MAGVWMYMQHHFLGVPAGGLLLVVLHGAKVGVEGRCYENHSTFFQYNMQLRGTLFKPKLEKQKKISSKKKNLIFSYILGKRNPERIPISGSKNPNKLLLFQEMELSSPSSKNKKIHSEKVSNILILKSFLYFLKRKLFLNFRERKPRKILILSQKKAFVIFRETETPKKYFIFQKELPSSHNQKFLIFLQKKVRNKFF